LKKIIILFIAFISILSAHAQDEDIILDSLIEMQIDSLVHPDIDTLHMTPEQRWVYRLQMRLDSVINRRRFAKVSTRVSRRSRRRVTKTIEYKYNLGCQIYDLSADSVLYSYHHQYPLKPASTQKLFVSITALSTLGMDYTFDTHVLTDGEIKTDSTDRRYLKGNIYIKGGFDPTLTFDDIRTIADSIKALGVDSIDGQIIAYVPQKQSLLNQHQWTWDNVPAGEEYFITPLTFNKGLTAPQVPRDPVLVTVGRGRRARKIMQVPAFRQSRIKHPEQYFVHSVCQLLKADSIKFAQTTPYDVQLTQPSEAFSTERSDFNRSSAAFQPSEASSTHQPQLRCISTISTPIAKVLIPMMKRSDNFYAESMLLNLCRQDDQWSYDKCKEQVRRMIGRAESDVRDYTIIDGSGLSHSNRTTPEQEIAILRYAFRTIEIFQPLYESLPIAGIDGTISGRMKTGPAFNNVRAKTGTLNFVTALSGYVTASNGHELAFSIMLNDVSTASVGRSIEDEICKELVK